MWHRRSMASKDGGEPIGPVEQVGHPFGRPAVLIPISSLAVVGLVALSWWQGSQRAQTALAQASVAGSIAAIVLSAVILGAGRQRQRSRAWLTQNVRTVSHRQTWIWPDTASVIVWILLLAAVLGWDLASFLRQSPELPTLSYLTGRMTRFHVGRSGLYLAWLLAGLWLALAQRRRRAWDARR
jgi:hypothetical protein